MQPSPPPSEPAPPPGCEDRRVFVAEDDPVSRRVVVALLQKWGYQVKAATDGTEAWQELQSSDAPRLVLLDWMMPGLEGVEICRRIRAETTRPYAYIVLITALGQKQNQLTALEAGADDYLVKPFDGAELRARLHVGRRILAAQDELIAAREALRSQASHDPLTGLWNHGETLRILEREVARAARSARPLAVLMVDLDHFKLINDRHGHLVGDAVLHEVASRLTASVRPYDAVGRFGGEEFLIVAPAMDPKAALELAHRIRESLADGPLECGGARIAVTSSLGVAVSSPERPPEPLLLVRAADSALYRAKEGGRNRVEICLPAELLPEGVSEPAPVHL